MGYTKLFERGQIGGLEIKNRIVMPAMGCSLAASTGDASPEIIRYYQERARRSPGWTTRPAWARPASCP